MTEQTVTCPVCEGSFGKSRRVASNRTPYGFKCDGCGRFEISRRAHTIWFGDQSQRQSYFPGATIGPKPRPPRGVKRIRANFCYTRLDASVSQGCAIAIPGDTSGNLIARIGDCETQEGKGLFVNTKTEAPLVGAFDDVMFKALLSELTHRGLIKPLEQAEYPLPGGKTNLRVHRVGLTLDGWNLYESEKRGRFAGDYGFIAMQFDDAALEELISDVVKPEVRTQVGYELVDMRNVAQAGIIDNIMRTQIRDAAFVLADLTHDNPGAYWEAGYAEGLGKPVIYLCEQRKFDAAKTHFDTNHCTTVMWSSDDPRTFVDTLVATLLRSLNLPQKSQTPTFESR